MPELLLDLLLLLLLLGLTGLAWLAVGVLDRRSAR